MVFAWRGDGDVYHSFTCVLRMPVCTTVVAHQELVSDEGPGQGIRLGFESNGLSGL